MTALRKFPKQAIPFMVMLAGFAFLLLTFIRISNCTANILTCKFEGISHLKESPFALFIYEMIYTSSAYSSLLLGLLLVGLFSLYSLIRSKINERLAQKTFWIIWAIGVVSFLISNVTLMLLPDPTYFPKYLEMMFTNADPGGAIYDQDIGPLRLWHFALPATVALMIFFIGTFTISTRTQAIILTAPLFVAPFILDYYRCYTSWDTGTPIYYFFFLNLLTPFLILAPTLTFIYLIRRGKSPYTNGR